jgi:two-component system, NtrC family, response regulator AtoC
MRDTGTAIEELENKIAAGQAIECEEQEIQSPFVAEKNGMRSVVRELKDRAEAQMIKDALDANGWNRRHAARSLNISYRGLLYKIQQHQLNPRAVAMSRPGTGL